MLSEKPKVGDKVKHPEKGICVVKQVYDEASGKPAGTTAVETEDGKNAFDANASELEPLKTKKSAP